MGPSFAYTMRGLVQPSKPLLDMGVHRTAILDVFFALNIVGGHVGLPLALGTMLATKTAGKRHPTLLNLLAFLIVFATAALLL